MNLCGEEWDQDHAQWAAGALWDHLRQGDTVLLLGERVRRVMSVPKLLVHPQEVRGVVIRQIPHPSGRCRWYNDPMHKSIASVLMEELYGRGQGHPEGAEQDPRGLH
jgi:hypothetical protein